MNTELAMYSTCTYAQHMSRMIQRRNVPDSLHRTLKAQAALSGMSLSDLLLAEIRPVAERPTIAELRERLRHRSRVGGRGSAAEAIRRERDAQ
jgi:antitoxin FitA